MEAFDILYSTNTFHFSDLDLIQDLPLLLPQQYLSKITSLEMLWNFNIDYKTNRFTDGLKSLWADPTRQDSPLHKACAVIPRSFPHLRRLYISIQSWIDPPGMGPRHDGISYVERVILGPVEDMLRSLEPGPGKEFKIAIQHGAWYVLLRKYYSLYGAKLRRRSLDMLTRGRFWKPLDLPGSQKGDHVEDFGYWICGGWDDMEYADLCYWMRTSWGDRWTGALETF